MPLVRPAVGHFATALLVAAGMLASCSAPVQSPQAAEPTAAPATASTATQITRAAAHTDRSDPNLIPRATLFGTSDSAEAVRGSPILSQDGENMVFTAVVGGKRQLFVGPIGSPDRAKQVTNEPDGFKGRGVQWAYTGKHLLYAADRDGDEDFRLYVLDLATNKVRNLTPVSFANAGVVALSLRFPDEALITISDRDPSAGDYYRLNFVTGAATPVFVNTLKFEGIRFDDDWTPRFGFKYGETSQQLWQRQADGRWTKFLETPFDGSEWSLQKLHGNTAYLIGAFDRDTTGLYAMDLTTRKMQLIFADDHADLVEAFFDEQTGAPQVVSTEYEKYTLRALDPAFEADIAKLKQRSDGELSIDSPSLSRPRWIVNYSYDDRPSENFLYERATGSLTPLWSTASFLEDLPLAKMHPVTVTARDGLKMVSYLTLPPSSDPDGDGRPTEPLPMVLDIHGGPWSRDSWHLNPEVQFLANRGYAVLQVNFRASTGFGKHYTQLGYGQWGRAMHTDLLDGVKWAIDNGIADPKHVAVYGGSYGGYASLWSITTSADIFSCAVAVVGPSNLTTFVENIPRSWSDDYMAAVLGDWRTQKGRADLLKYSPVTYAAQVKDPLLIIQGANDPRVVKTESDQMVNAMIQAKVPVTYALYPDEGHGVSRRINVPGQYAMIEQFLAQPTCLGGHAEAYGDALKGSSLTVPQGAELIPGFAEALQRR